MQVINFRLRLSWQLLTFFLSMYVLILLAVFSSMAPLWLKGISAILVLIHAYYVLSAKVFLKGARAITAINCQENHVWQLTLNKGSFQQASLCGHSFISRYAMILNFTSQSPRKRFSVLLVPPMLGQENFRQLFVYCRTIRLST